MKKLNIQDFLNRANLTQQRNNGLVLFDYNKTVTYEFDWDETTINSRGIVFEESTGLLVARPYRKFWNHGEIGSRELLLPVEYRPNFNGPYMVLDKADGSCGIVYWYNDKWNINTRGSFASDQAIWATKWFNENVRHESMNKRHTYMVEIIYPENRIVVDYGEKKALVLTGIIDTETGYEFFYNHLKAEANAMGIEMVKVFVYNEFKDLFVARESLGVNEEGFVITFENGYKFKLKGDEYCRIHRTISNLTPLNFWRAIDINTFKISVDFLAALPEEFRETADILKDTIESLHQDAIQIVLDEVKRVPVFENDADGRKARYLWLVDNVDSSLVHSVLGMITNSETKTRENIHQKLRPTGNSLNAPNVLDRINRILGEQ